MPRWFMASFSSWIGDRTSNGPTLGLERLHGLRPFHCGETCVPCQHLRLIYSMYIGYSCRAAVLPAGQGITWHIPSHKKHLLFSSIPVYADKASILKTSSDDRDQSRVLELLTRYVLEPRCSRWLLWCSPVWPALLTSITILSLSTLISRTEFSGHFPVLPCLQRIPFHSICMSWVSQPDLDHENGRPSDPQTLSSPCNHGLGTTIRTHPLSE
jgi:hypothetical protein